MQLILLSLLLLSLASVICSYAIASCLSVLLSATLVYLAHTSQVCWKLHRVSKKTVPLLFLNDSETLADFDNAHHKLVYNIGSKFDGGACNYKNCQRLPMVVYLVHLRS